MQFIEKEIREYTENIWKSILSLEAKPSSNDSPDEEKKFDLIGCIHITGAWDGTVTIDFPMSLAKRVATIMFSLNEQNLELEMIQDALGELTNITGGNIKSLLPEPCQLSLPTVAVTAKLRVPGSETISRVNFQCAGDDFRVSLLKKMK